MTVANDKTSVPVTRRYDLNPFLMTNVLKKEAKSNYGHRCMIKHVKDLFEIGGITYTIQEYDEKKNLLLKGSD